VPEGVIDGISVVKAGRMRGMPSRVGGQPTASAVGNAGPVRAATVVGPVLVGQVGHAIVPMQLMPMPAWPP
jgi:hypothetical protein